MLQKHSFKTRIDFMEAVERYASTSSNEDVQQDIQTWRKSEAATFLESLQQPSSEDVPMLLPFIKDMGFAAFQER